MKTFFTIALSLFITHGAFAQSEQTVCGIFQRNDANGKAAVMFPTLQVKQAIYSLSAASANYQVVMAKEAMIKSMVSGSMYCVSGQTFQETSNKAVLIPNMVQAYKRSY